MIRKTYFSLLLILVTLAACSPTAKSGASNAGLAAWIDAPLDETILPLAPYEIVAHASDPSEVASLEILINDVHLTSYNNPYPEDLLLTVTHEWRPIDPGIYEIKARSQNASGEWSNFAIVQVEVKEDFSPLVLAPIPTEILAFELTTCNPSLTAISNTTCRLGPSSYHLPATYLLEGESAPILGRNKDSSWWLTELPDLENPCWIADQTVTAVCIPEDLNFANSPPYISRVTKSNTEFYWGDHPQHTIAFQAQVGGESAVESLIIFYHLQGKTDWSSTAFTNTSGDIWEGTIQAHSIKNYRNVSSSILEYYLEATNINVLTSQTELMTDVKLKKVP